MQYLFYRLKTSTVINFLIFSLAVTVLLQGALAIYHNVMSSKNALYMAESVISNDVDDLLALFSSIDPFVDMIETDNSFITDPASDATDKVFIDAKAFNKMNTYFKNHVNDSYISTSLNNLLFFLSDEYPLEYIAPVISSNHGIESYSNTVGIYRQPDSSFISAIQDLSDSTEASIWIENISNRLLLCFCQNIYVREVHRNTLITHKLGVLYISYDLKALLNQIEMLKAYPSSIISFSYKDEIIYSSNDIAMLNKNDCLEYTYKLYPELYLTTIISKNDINGSLYIQVMLEVVTFIFLALFGSLMILYINRAILKPITKMAKHLITNDLIMLPIEHNLTPEITALYKNHNIMVEHTQKSIRDSQRSYYKMLQAQINPHFTYNVLNSISATSLIRGDFETAQTLSDLVDMMRYAIRSPEALVSFAEELEIIKKFISIQNSRYPNKVIVEYAIPEELLNTPMPKLTLQPLVENSVFHSNINLVVSNIHIDITADKTEDDVCIIIHDRNTVNADYLNEYLQSAVAESTSDRRGLGICNINQRLGFVFGQKYGLEYKSDENGLYAIITIPG